MSRSSCLFPRYAIGRLLLAEFERQGLSRADLGRRMGYPNPAKGLIRFDNLVRGGAEPTYVFDRIVHALGLSPDVVGQAMAETHEAIRIEEAEAARIEETCGLWAITPYVVIETSRSKPEPIHIGILAYGLLRRIEVPRAVTITPITEQIEWLGHRVASHFVERKGCVLAFGEITGYRYRRTYDSGIMFDVQGRVTSHYADRPGKGRGTLFAKCTMLRRPETL